MITKITNTPNSIAASKLYAKSECRKPVKLAQRFDYRLNTDTVTFSANKSKSVANLVDLAFSKLAQSRQKQQLGSYIGTKGKTNFHLQETEFGKKALLSVIRGKEFANFELSRGTNQAPMIKVLDREVSSQDAQNIAARYLNSIK